MEYERIRSCSSVKPPPDYVDRTQHLTIPLILDARYEKVRDDGIIQSQAVLIAIGI